MTTEETIFSTLHDWVVTATDLEGKKVVQYNPNAPEPTGQMFVINPNAVVTPIGLMDELQYTATGVYSVKGHRSVLASLHCYGKGAVSQMAAVMACQDAPSIRKIFRDAKITLVECRQIRNLSAPKGARIEERAQMDVMLRYAEVITDTVETTKAVEFQIEAIEYALDADPDVLDDLIATDDYVPPTP